MKLTVVGSGDAFGSGGRLQTCFHVATAERAFLVDCGATALIGMERANLDPGRVDAIFITHLHGDHFSGLVWWMLHSQHVVKRERPLLVVGPRGIEARYRTAAEALFPGSTEKEMRFKLQFQEHSTERPFEWRDLSCSAIEVNHPSGAPAHGLRFDMPGFSFSFSGDTEWVDGLIGLADGVDLHINECFAYDNIPNFHTSWFILQEKLPQLRARRILLTHMGREMLAKTGEVDDPRVMISQDGMCLEF